MKKFRIVFNWGTGEIEFVETAKTEQEAWEKALKKFNAMEIKM